MHELFLTSVNGVQNADVGQNLKVLQGLCGMAPVHKFERLVAFEGPETGPLPPLPRPYVDRSRPQWDAYNQLNKQLQRQSYYLNVGYSVAEEDLGPILTENDVKKRSANLDELPGTIHFLDYPDPTHISQATTGKPKVVAKNEPIKPPVNTRLVLHLTDTRIPSLMTTLSYKFRSERLQESYSFYRDNVTLTLSRDLVRKNSAENSWDTVRQTLPMLEDWAPFDEANRWLLRASVEVSEEKAGPLRQRAIDELLRMKRDLVGFHELELFDRDVFDTRVAAFLANARRR